MPPFPGIPWHKTRDLSFFDKMIDEMMEAFKGQYQSLLEVKETPHLLDKTLLKRTLEACNQSFEVQKICTDYLEDWLSKNPSSSQRQKAEQLKVKLGDLKEWVDSTLDLAHSLRELQENSLKRTQP